MMIKLKIYKETDFVKMVGKSMIAGIRTVVVQENVLKNLDCEFFKVYLGYVGID
jgi:hypothetical protein